MADFRDEEFMRLIADGAAPAESEPAPSRLKAKIYSALMFPQAQSGLLMSSPTSRLVARDSVSLRSLCELLPWARGRSRSISAECAMHGCWQSTSNMRQSTGVDARMFSSRSPEVSDLD